MNSKIIFFYLQGIWRRKWMAVAICWAVCVVGWLAVFFVPNTYESMARVYVDVDSMLTPLLRGLAVEANPLQQLDFMQRTLLSRPNLEQVIHLADLDSQAKTPEAKDGLLTALAQEVHISLQGSNLFSIAYDDTDAVESKNVVKAVLTVFSESSAGNSRTDMDNARRFLDEQITNYEKQLRAAEERRAEFKETYGDILPQSQANESRFQQAIDEVGKLKLQLQDAQARRDAIAKDAASVPATLSLDQAAQVVIHNGSSESPKQLELDETKRKLSDLQSRYTDDFPNVVATKRDITNLEASIKADGSGTGGSDDSRKSTVPNPLYQEVKMRLVDAESTVASAQRQLDFSESEQKRLQEAVKAAPGIQLQAQNLDRDYNVPEEELRRAGSAPRSGQSRTSGRYGGRQGAVPHRRRTAGAADADLAEPADPLYRRAHRRARRGPRRGLPPRPARPFLLDARRAACLRPAGPWLDLARHLPRNAQALRATGRWARCEHGHAADHLRRLIARELHHNPQGDLSDGRAFGRPHTASGGAPAGGAAAFCCHRGGASASARHSRGDRVPRDSAAARQSRRGGR